MGEYKSRNPFQGIGENLATFDGESYHIHSDTMRNEFSEGIAENPADDDEEFNHINANTVNNDLSAGIPEKLTKVVQGTEDTDTYKAMNNDNGAIEIHGTDSSGNNISCDQKTENYNGKPISSGPESSSTGKTPTHHNSIQQINLYRGEKMYFNQ